MKDELGGNIITEFVALQQRCMPMERQTQKWMKSAAKVQKILWLVKALRLFDDYKACLFDDETTYKERMLFANKKHGVTIISVHGQ